MDIHSVVCCRIPDSSNGFFGDLAIFCLDESVARRIHTLGPYGMDGAIGQALYNNVGTGSFHDGGVRHLYLYRTGRVRDFIKPFQNIGFDCYYSSAYLFSLLEGKEMSHCKRIKKAVSKVKYATKMVSFVILSVTKDLDRVKKMFPSFNMTKSIVQTTFQTAFSCYIKAPECPLLLPVLHRKE